MISLYLRTCMALCYVVIYEPQPPLSKRKDDWANTNFPFFSLLGAVESTSEIVEGTYGHRSERLIYGVFTTPENSIFGSAICAFRMQDILDSFNGPFRV